MEVGDDVVGVVQLDVDRGERLEELSGEVPQVTMGAMPPPSTVIVWSNCAPGSLTAGVPASLTRATLRPAPSCATICAARGYWTRAVAQAP